MKPLGTLHPKPPYNLHRSAWLLNRYHSVLDIYDGTHYRRALTTQNGTALVQVTDSTTDPVDPQLDVSLLNDDLTAPNELLRQVGYILGVDFDLAPFYAVAAADERLTNVIEPLRGLRHFQAETLFEAMMTVIIEQQISLKSALRAQRALAEWGGGQVTHDGTDYYTSPTAHTIAAADHDELHGVLRITHRRVDLMQRIAQSVVNNDLDLEGFRTADSSTAYDCLIAIKGVGHWTVAWTLIRGASCYDYVGYNDVALRDAVAFYFYDTEERVSEAQVKAVFDRFIPHDGIAAFYTLMRWAVDRY